jgi:hypothetical protein
MRLLIGEGINLKPARWLCQRSGDLRSRLDVEGKTDSKAANPLLSGPPLLGFDCLHRRDD